MYNRGIYAVFSIHLTHIMLIEYMQVYRKIRTNNLDLMISINTIF